MADGSIKATWYRPKDVALAQKRIATRSLAACTGEHSYKKQGERAGRQATGDYKKVSLAPRCATTLD